MSHSHFITGVAALAVASTCLWGASAYADVGATAGQTAPPTQEQQAGGDAPAAEEESGAPATDATTDAAATADDAATGATPSTGGADAASASGDEGAAAATTVESQAQTTGHVAYRAHVQDIGWQDEVQDGATAGTTGRALQVEALDLSLEGLDGGIEYRAHVQDIGWQGWVKDGAQAGTTGRALRIEAVQIRLTGAIAETYDVYYRAHVADIGWQGWVKDGAQAGTTGQCKRVEAIEVVLVKKGDAAPATGQAGADYATAHPVTITTPDKPDATDPTISYQAHVQDIGWQDAVEGGTTAGTTGKSLHVEALRLSLENVGGGVQYDSRAVGGAWQGWVGDDEVSGTTGQNQALEAIRVRLTGSAASSYDVWYRVHVSNIGWMAWTKDGATAGTELTGQPIEAVQVELLPKGSAGPSNADAATSLASFESPAFTYRANVGTLGWQAWQQDGATAGTTGRSLPVTQLAAKFTNDAGMISVEYATSANGSSWSGWSADGAATGSRSSIKAVRMRLSGTASAWFDVWYRVHVSNIGWLGWTKDGNAAGTDIAADQIEAVQVVVEPAGDRAPGATLRAFAQQDVLNGIDIASYQNGIDLSAINADFVIIKATQGTTYVNPYWKQWAQSTLDNGKLLGLYHYASGGDPTAEADFFYDTIKAYKGRAVVVLDWEGIQNRSFRQGNDAAWCKAFMDRIAEKMGATPILYISKNVTRQVDWTSVARSYPLWAAQYASSKIVNGYDTTPWTDRYTFGAWSNPKIYQYTSSGLLDGWGKVLDLDLFYGSEADWRALE